MGKNTLGLVWIASLFDFKTNESLTLKRYKFQLVWFLMA